MAVDTGFHIKVAPTQTTASGLGTATLSALFEKSLSWPSGTGANQADRLYQQAGATIAGSATTQVDLTGTLMDAFGTLLAMVRVKCVAVYAYPANANDIQLTRPATGVAILGATADYVVIRPGGIFVWIAPDATAVPVAAGTADLINLTNAGAGTVTYDLVVLGASA